MTDVLAISWSHVLLTAVVLVSAITALAILFRYNVHLKVSRDEVSLKAEQPPQLPDSAKQSASHKKERGQTRKLRR